MRVPVKIIVDRVINAALIFAAVTEVGRSDAEVIEKHRVVGTRSQGRNSQVGALAHFLAVLVSLGFDNLMRLRTLPDADLLLRIFRSEERRVGKECSTRW